MKRLLIRSLKIAFLFLFWSQAAFGQCALDDFLAEIRKNGLKDLFKESPEEYFEAWKIIYSEKDEVLALIRQNPDNLKKIKNYIDVQLPNLDNLKKSFQSARDNKQAQAWIDLKIPKNDLEDVYKAMDLMDDPPSWTPKHKAKSWQNYQASNEPKLGFAEWSNVYDGNILKSSTAGEVVKNYLAEKGLTGFEVEYVFDDLEITLRGKQIKGGRRVDAYNETTKTALEVKDYRSHNVCLSEDIEREVRMDLKLLEESEDIDVIEWIFLGKGPSGPLKELLETELKNGKKVRITTVEVKAK